jgi:hypothetical protein
MNPPGTKHQSTCPCPSFHSQVWPANPAYTLTRETREKALTGVDAHASQFAVGSLQPDQSRWRRTVQ